MKKKLFIGISAVAVAAVATVNVNLALQGNHLSALELANMEVLAYGEVGGGKKCYNSITTNSSKMVFYCGSCSFVSGDSSWYSGTGRCP